jgi:hypothetical protein
MRKYRVRMFGQPDLVWLDTDDLEAARTEARNYSLASAAHVWLILTDANAVLERYHMGQVITREAARALADGKNRPAECHCVFRHAITPDERAAVSKELDYSRKISDLRGIQLALVRLAGYCPARNSAGIDTGEGEEQ